MEKWPLADHRWLNWSGLVGETPPLKIVLLPDEAFYVSRLVSADVQRMTEARDHGVSHGMRGYAPPNLEVGLNVLHSLDTARTSATMGGQYGTLHVYA